MLGGFRIGGQVLLVSRVVLTAVVTGSGEVEFPPALPTGTVWVALCPKLGRCGAYDKTVTPLVGGIRFCMARVDWLPLF